MGEDTPTTAVGITYQIFTNATGKVLLVDTTKSKTNFYKRKKQLNYILKQIKNIRMTY